MILSLKCWPSIIVFLFSIYDIILSLSKGKIFTAIGLSVLTIVYILFFNYLCDISQKLAWTVLVCLFIGLIFIMYKIGYYIEKNKTNKKNKKIKKE